MSIPDGFYGKALRLTQEDIDRVSARLGVDTRTIWAVASVEASLRGFLDDGRPQLLFESHQFHNLTGGRFDLSNPGISTSTWIRNYGAGGAHQYDRLAEAIALDKNAALQAATWGMFQVLGSNYKMVGYASVDAFVEAMCYSEGRHLDAFGAYCTARKLIRSLSAMDWKEFALGYNGPGQVNAYAAQLLTAYQNGKMPTFPPDHPAPPMLPPEMPIPLPIPLPPPMPQEPGPAPTPPVTMPTPAQYTSIGAVLAALVPVLMWLTDLPLKPLSEAQAGALGVVLIGIVGLVHTAVQSYRDRN